jgi:hypothetical protein
MAIFSIVFYQLAMKQSKSTNMTISNQTKNRKKKSHYHLVLRKKLERGGELPPGWQKKVARGEVLDSDLYAASKPLPRDISDRLPESPEGTIIRQIDDRIVRVMEATNVIIDVLGGSH